jgi:hypothetical protein
VAVTTPLTQNFNFRGTRDLKLGFEILLRSIFADPIIVKNENFRYVPPMGTTPSPKNKISIFRTNPNRIELYPALIISRGSYDTNLMGLGEERENASEKIVNGVLTSSSYVGHKVVPIQISVRAKGSGDDRDILTDLLEEIFRVLARNKFGLFGVGFTNISVGEETQEEGDDGNIIYGSSIMLQCNTDYSYIIDVAQEGLIKSIFLRVYGQISKNSPLIPLHPMP